MELESSQSLRGVQGQLTLHAGLLGGETAFGL